MTEAYDSAGWEEIDCMRLPGTMVQSEGEIIEQSSSSIAGSSISLTCPRLVHHSAGFQRQPSADFLAFVSPPAGAAVPFLAGPGCLRGTKEKSMFWENMIQSPTWFNVSRNSREACNRKLYSNLTAIYIKTFLNRMVQFGW